MTAPARLHARAATDEHAPARVAATSRPVAPAPAPPAVVPRPRHPVRRVRRPDPVCPVPPRGRGGVAPARPVVFPGHRLVHLVLAVAVTLVVVGALAWLGQAADAGVPAETAVVRVGAGETVWDVAERVAPESDARAVVQRIKELNAMTGSAVQPGQRLRVPDGQ